MNPEFSFFFRSVARRYHYSFQVMKISRNSSMAIVKALLVLLLALFPLQASAGRQLLLATLKVQTPTCSQPAPAAGRESGGEVGKVPALEDGAPVQHRGLDNSKRKQVKTGESIYGHRLLVGSSAPTCQGKCGPCIPCSPIHMAIGSPHGALTLQEYYPEVWRCKCGGIYFMP